MDKYLKRKGITSVPPNKINSDNEETVVSKAAKVDEPDIWNYFQKIRVKEGDKVIFKGKCKLCLNAVYKLPTSTTSPLHTHFQTKHEEEWRKFDRIRAEKAAKKKKEEEERHPSKTQPTLPDSIEKMTPWDTSHYRHQEMNRHVCEFIIKGYHPYSIVEEEGFVNLMKQAQPLYKIPSRNTFSRNLIPKMYTETKVKKIDEFKADQPSLSSVSLTTDIWSAHQNSYISLTCHYLDEDFRYKSFCWGHSKLSGSHTGLNIKAALTAKAKEWNLNETLPVYIVADNAKNMSSGLSEHERYDYRPCSIHTLQLAIADAVKDVKGFQHMCSKAQGIVGHFKHSTSASDILREIQIKQKEPELSVIQNVSTRWNSEYDMLERLLKIRRPLSAALSELDTDIANLTSEDWKICESYIEVLAFAKEGTETLGSNTYPTSSFIYPFLKSYQNKLSQFIQSSKNVKGVAFAKSLLKSLKSRFALFDQDKVTGFSMILDPRFKLSLIPKDKINYWLNLLTDEILELGLDGNRTQPDFQASSSSSTPISIWSHIHDLQSANIPSTSITNRSVVEEELNRYVNSPTLPPQINPYDYWATDGKHAYKLLLKCVRKYLPIPASEINSERQFSTSGLIVTDRRACLLPANVEILTFLHENIKYTNN